MTLITIFDVETSGLPPRVSKYRRYPDPEIEYMAYDSARVIELAYTMYAYDENTKTKELVKSVSCLVNPNGAFEIQNTWIHGITHDTCAIYGSPIEDVLRLFMNDVARSDKLIAHNIEFDLNIVLAECYRAGINPGPMIRIVKRCTMKSAMRILGLDRFPKLVDLYNNICSASGPWKQTHRALDDTERCADVYFQLHRMQHHKTISVCV